MSITNREVAVLLACEAIGTPWHLHYMSRIAATLGAIMTETEVASLYDDLIAKGCIKHQGSLLYAVTPLGEAFCARWRERQGK